MPKHSRPKQPDLLSYLIWRGIDAAIEDFQRRLTLTVTSSIKACPDVSHAAVAATDMIESAFARLRGVR